MQQQQHQNKRRHHKYETHTLFATRSILSFGGGGGTGRTRIRYYLVPLIELPQDFIEILVSLNQINRGQGTTFRQEMIPNPLHVPQTRNIKNRLQRQTIE
eukprot:TRINITY_DN4422_c0_g3_i1.p1 TRINITY_DN4422_c0_g3~~TRINITY_DN4422_c0_g3_i1.p1  ORF type:complete len:100 (+),score=15.65 TRINITY_DN4422_c0_g3_i1:278-577(+)